MPKMKPIKMAVLKVNAPDDPGDLHMLFVSDGDEIRYRYSNDPPKQWHDVELPEKARKKRPAKR